MNDQQAPSEFVPRQVVERALELAGDGPAEVALYYKSGALTRFANNAIHQNVSEVNAELYLRIVEKGRAGLGMTNQLDDQSLSGAIDRARAAAAFGPPALESLAPRAADQPVDALDQRAIDHPAETRAEKVRQVCDSAEAHGAQAFGAYSVEVNQVVFANQAGLYQEHHGSAVDFQTVVMRDGASGWAQDAGWNLDSVSVLELAEEALRKALDAADAGPVEPEPLPVVLDPYATADIINMLDAPGMGGRAVAEQRSWMNDRLGEQAMSSLVSIWDDGRQLDGIPAPFDAEGVLKQRVPLVAQGVVQQPVYDRATAQQAEVKSTGHALGLNLRPTARRYSPLATNLFMQAGEASTDELIHSTDRGLYITRFWYTRHVHPRDCVVTGMTRDGVFLIEGGKVTRPAKNLRFTQSYVDALSQVETVGSETRLVTEDFLGSVVRAPALKIRSFRFTGLTV